ncbi:MAG: hypothetical protein M1820_010594 [Bogoriella megaspora]|nr:MAG: hypothetical protein M1820_010594 [Bogoriella megaspora]
MIQIINVLEPGASSVNGANLSSTVRPALQQRSNSNSRLVRKAWTSSGVTNATEGATTLGRLLATSIEATVPQIIWEL